MAIAYRNSIFALISILVVFAAAAIGNMATIPNIPTWYAALNKPFYNPPNWIFGPVWTALYLALAVSFWRILKADHDRANRRSAIIIFSIQMILNSLWSIVFFHFHAPAIAVGVVIALEMSILTMIRVFGRIDRIAAALQWPYAAWVAFATLLNLGIVILN